MAKGNPTNAAAWWALGTAGGALLGAWAVYHLGPGAKERRDVEKKQELAAAPPQANPYGQVGGQVIPPPPPAPIPFPYPVPVSGFGQQQQQPHNPEQHHHYYGPSSMPAMPAMPGMPAMEAEPNPDDEVEVEVEEPRDPVEDIIGDWDAHGYED